MSAALRQLLRDDDEDDNGDGHVESNIKRN